MNRIGRAVGRVALVVLVVAAIALSASDPFTLLTVLTSCAVGAFLIDRRPRNAVGWLVLAIGLSNLATTTRPNLDIPGLVAGNAPWIDFLAVWVSAWAGGAVFVCYAAVAFVFPSGALVQRHRPAIRIALLASALVATVPQALSPSIEITGPNGANLPIPNLFSPAGADATFTTPAAAELTGTMLPILVLAAGVIDLLRRYRRAVGIERLQMRWLLTAIAFLFVSLSFGLTLVALGGEELGVLPWIPTLLASPTIALAIGVAILRYRLYDIDRLISRTLSWAMVTASVLAIFATLVIGFQATLARFMETGTIAVAVSTLVAAALFQPIRRRVQESVDRRFDRARYDGRLTAAAFADRLRTGVDLDAVVEDLTATADQAVRPTTASLWLLNTSDRSGGRP